MSLCTPTASHVCFLHQAWARGRVPSCLGDVLFTPEFALTFVEAVRELLCEGLFNALLPHLKFFPDGFCPSKLLLTACSCMRKAAYSCFIIFLKTEVTGWCSFSLMIWCDFQEDTGKDPP